MFYIDAFVCILRILMTINDTTKSQISVVRRYFPK